MWRQVNTKLRPKKSKLQKSERFLENTKNQKKQSRLLLFKKRNPEKEGARKRTGFHKPKPKNRLQSVRRPTKTSKVLNF
jgi:hypothetical protein